MIKYFRINSEQALNRFNKNYKCNAHGNTYEEPMILKVKNNKYVGFMRVHECLLDKYVDKYGEWVYTAEEYKVKPVFEL